MKSGSARTETGNIQAVILTVTKIFAKNTKCQMLIKLPSNTQKHSVISQSLFLIY